MVRYYGSDVDYTYVSFVVLTRKPLGFVIVNSDKTLQDHTLYLISNHFQRLLSQGSIVSEYEKSEPISENQFVDLIKTVAFLIYKW